jgi:hypothetical protein
MGDHHNLDARVTALEAERPQIRQNLAETRLLAEGADRDVSEFAVKLDAQKALLVALRETQVEQGKEIAWLRREMRQEFVAVRQEMRQEFVAVRQEMQQEFIAVRQEMQHGFSTLAVGQAQISALLKSMAEADGEA